MKPLSTIITTLLLPTLAIFAQAKTESANATKAAQRA
jgi:hypothetical protein